MFHSSVDGSDAVSLALRGGVDVLSASLTAAGRSPDFGRTFGRRFGVGGAG